MGFEADSTFATLLACVALAVTTEAVIGFGSVLITLTLGANLYPISALVPLLVCMNVMLTAYIALRHRQHIAGRLLRTRILPAMALGMAAGYTLFAHAPESVLRKFLGSFVVVIASIELRRSIRPQTGAAAPISDFRLGATALIAGIVHGVTATGGPVLVYALSRLGLDKSTFRSTLASVWLVLNGGLIVAYLADGRLAADNAAAVAALAPVVATAALVGDWLHARLVERGFRILVLIFLLLAGLSLIL